MWIPVVAAATAAAVGGSGVFPAAPAVVEFYAPWCGACQRFAPEFASASLALRTLNIATETINCDVEILCDTMGVRAYPTVMAITADAGVEVYNGAHTAEPVVAWAAGLFRLAPVAVQPVSSTPAQPRPPLPTRSHHVAGAGDALVGLFVSARGMPTVADAVLGDAMRALVEAMAAAHPVLRDAPARLGPAHTPLTRAVAVAALADAEAAVLPTTFCNGSLPCTLWTMLHAAAGATPGGVAALRAGAIVVMRTFGCAECAAHFGEMAVGDVAGVPALASVECDAAAARWVWLAHNVVNARVGAQPFPSSAECPHCETDADVAAYVATVYRDAIGAATGAAAAAPPPPPGQPAAVVSALLVGSAVGAAAAGIGMLVWRRRSAAATGRDPPGGTEQLLPGAPGAEGVHV